MSARADWRLVIDDSAQTGARNMAVDHALFESVQQGGAPVLRLYRWAPACLSLGRNQHAVGIYDPVRAQRAGIDIVRRSTGGLGVLHDDELTYCVLAPADALGGPRAAYASINRALVDGLRRLGIDAELAAGTSPVNPKGMSAQPCFRTPAAGEVVAHGRKLVGSAQRCEKRTLLQHGSILLAGSQVRVLDLLVRPVPDAGPDGAITVSQLLGRAPDWTLLCDGVAAGFEAIFGIALAPDTVSASECQRTNELETWYGSADWTWRM